MSPLKYICVTCEMAVKYTKTFYVLFGTITDCLVSSERIKNTWKRLNEHDRRQTSFISVKCSLPFLERKDLEKGR